MPELPDRRTPVHQGQVWDHRQIADFTARVAGDPIGGFVTIDTVHNGLPDGRHLLTVPDLQASWVLRGAS